MTLVIDASVACKWFFNEAGTAEARQILGSGDLLPAPELICAEVGNIAWRRYRTGEIPIDQARDVAIGLVQLIDEVVALTALAQRALNISLLIDHSIYDCFYLALAEARDSRLITADRRFARRLERTEWSQRVGTI